MENEVKQVKPKRNYSIYFKTAFITVLVLLLMIPAAFVKDLIREREMYKSQTTSEIARSWGPSQNVSGPIITIPYKVKHAGTDGVEDFIASHEFFITPTDLVIDANIDT